MDEVQYIGEHAWPGIAGHFFIISAFVSALFASIAFFLSVRHSDQSKRAWLKTGRGFFLVHGISVIGIISILFFAMINKYYEYAYVFEHVSDDLPMQYVLSAFWEGQEGSFLLWMFWHIVLGFIIVFKRKSYEGGTLAVLLLIETFLSSMLLGIHIPIGEGFKLGSNPTLLLRNVMDAPIFQSPDYLQLIDGRGLNILLQNYWNTIHPPTLFLGFASVSIPFCISISGLLTGKHKEHLGFIMPWALFSSAIFGLGILMGAAWAYEALTFGGYWAWDPVENMSLVPWLMLIGGLHTNLVARSTGYSIRSTYIFYAASFLLVVYSTYLTRSGILGDTSVHAFTELGLNSQLTLFILFFLLGTAGILAYTWKKIESPRVEEKTQSREFWMFIGALVLVISSAMITYSTSLPLFNKIIQYFDPTYEGMVLNDPEAHYNRYQLWVGLLLALISALAIQLRYAGRNWDNQKTKVLKKVGIAAAAALALTILTGLFSMHAARWNHLVLAFGGYFTLISNLEYLTNTLKFNLKLGGSALSHAGFGILILGILFSGINKSYITYNPFVQQNLIEGFDEEEIRRNTVLLKEEPLPVQGYTAIFTRDTLINRDKTYYVQLVEMDQEGNLGKSYEMTPNVIYEEDFSGIVAYNPSIKRGLSYDIFTRIAGLPEQEIDRGLAQNFDDSLEYKLLHLSMGDTTFTDKFWYLPKEIYRPSEIDKIIPDRGDFPIALKLEIGNMRDNSSVTVDPSVLLRGAMSYKFYEPVQEYGLRVKLGDSILLPYMSPLELPNAETFKAEKLKIFEYDKYKISFQNVSDVITHSWYEKVEGDIALSAELIVRDPEEGKVYVTEAVYIIRDNRVFQHDAFIPEENLSIRFEKLYTEDGSIDFTVGKMGKGSFRIPLAVAENVPRTDYISFQAIKFPGINLVWLGSLLMLFGLALSWWVKRF